MIRPANGRLPTAHGAAGLIFLAASGSRGSGSNRLAVVEQRPLLSTIGARDMSEVGFKGTPGPWSLSCGSIIGSAPVHTNGLQRNRMGISSASYSEVVCHVHGWVHAECRTLTGSPTAPLDNAALITQAPAMLSVITNFVRAFDNVY